MTSAASIRSLLVLMGFLCACGGAISPGTTSAPSLPPLTKNTWSWIDVPGTSCGDGSQTGVGMNPGDGPGLLVFMNGGGACFDYVSCFVAKAAGSGSFGRADFDALIAARAPGSILDRSDPLNPYRDDELGLCPVLHR